MIHLNYIKRNWRRRLRFPAWVAILCAHFGTPVAAVDTPTIFAAASTTQPIEAIAKLFKQQHGIDLVPVFAASGALARQIDHGAPADLYLSANPRWMDWLERRHRLIPDSRRDLIGNCLVLIQPQGEAPLPPLSSNLVPLLGARRLALGDPAYVPAGEYAVSVLRKIGIWKTLSVRTARLPSVRHVLFLVARREAAAGIVYRSDALTSARVHIAETIDPKLHNAIVYPLARIKRANASKNSQVLYKFLVSPTALSIFERYGFRPLLESCSD